MFQLSISAACLYVRRALDELTSVEEIGMLVYPDGMDLHKLVEGAIVEAAVKVHNLAPAIMIEGVKGEASTNVRARDYTASIDEDGVMTIRMEKEAIRIASLKASDSEVVICELIPEDSAEGRKQLNKYVRGVPDDPRAVLQKEPNGDHKPIVKYYAFGQEQKDAEGNAIPRTIELYYVPYPKIEETIVEISPALEYAVLNEVTAMVMDSLGEREKASLYREKSINYMQGK